MKNYFITPILSVLFICLFSLTVTAQQYQGEVAKADSLFRAGQKKQAQTLYQKAAKKGSAEAHVALAYKYIVSPKESIYHFSEAAKQGNEKALKNVLEELLFRANSLTLTDPQRALDLYHQAKKANPDLKLYDEETKVRVMKESAVTQNFDGEAFMRKYNITSEKTDQHPFWIWELAEDASTQRQHHNNHLTFGKPDPKLLLALVVRGGFAPASKETAIDSVYNDYKKGIVRPFNICNYITSGYGGSFCARRGAEEFESHRRFRMRKLKKQMNAKAGSLLTKTYQAAAAFIDAKAEREEQHGGSGRGAWITNSEVKQKDEFVNLVDSVMHGFIPNPDHTFKQTDQQLNQIYKKAIEVLAKEDQPFQYFTKPKDLRAVQRLWIPYRDKTVKLFHVINPDVGESIWKAWLTEQRINQLNEIPGM